jgi:RNA polymerase sigma-70 factor, ECF subfamily
VNEIYLESVFIVGHKWRWKMEDFVTRCKSRDISGLEYLYETYKSKVFRTAFLMTKNIHLSEDITQETFIRVFNKIDRFDSCSSFEPWLYKVTVNVTRNILRKNSVIQLLTGKNNDYDYSLIDKILKKEQDDFLGACISRLSFKTKSVIVLKYFNGFSQEEISSILEIPVGTVKSRIHNGLNKLRVQLEGENLRGIEEVWSND